MSAIKYKNSIPVDWEDVSFAPCKEWSVWLKNLAWYLSSVPSYKIGDHGQILM